MCIYALLHNMLTLLGTTVFLRKTFGEMLIEKDWKCLRLQLLMTSKIINFLEIKVLHFHFTAEINMAYALMLTKTLILNWGKIKNKI